MDQNNKKVYVNPNFTRLPNKILQQNNVMHVNPLFAYQNRQVQQSSAKPISKIYVNRNFITSKNNQNAGITRNPAFENMMLTNNYSMPQIIFGLNRIESKIPDPTPASTSRYSLVRYNNISEKQNNTKIITKLPEKVTNTVKVNKYKTVQVEAIKKNLNTINSSLVCSTKEIVVKNHAEKQINPSQNVVNNITKSRYSIVKNDKSHTNVIYDKLATKTKLKCSHEGSNIKSLIYKYKLTHNAFFKKINLNSTKKHCNMYKVHNRFKLVKENITPAEICGYETSKNRRLSFNLKKKVHKLISPAKINHTVTKFNKNNIPCPLFRKYGKCIRNIKGNCKFVHDKKHVSICRKFIKGICHDEGCLLSHDVTSKKMPTCYFYLQGICTKENCPYLHVKLNENTKICADFLKGFCEKGENCFHRHINICPDLAVKGICLRKTCPYPHKSTKNDRQNSRSETMKKKMKNNKIERDSKQVIQQYNTKTNDSTTKTTQEIYVADSRYYRDAITNTTVIEKCEVIPSRCKLGILPSFIQL